MPSWDWQASLIGLLLALAATKIVGQQGTKSAWAPRATLHLSIPIGHWAHATGRLENLQGRSSALRPSSQPSLQGEVDLGAACQAGGSQSLLARGQPSLTLKQNRCGPGVRSEARWIPSPDSPCQRYQAEINDLENLGEMGSGTCGQVWKMRFRKTGHVIAVKQMRRSGNKEENKRILMDLDVVLKSHDCPYIVQCFGTFITNTDVFIAMELMGTCAEKLKKRMQGPIPERILGKMTVAIVKALYYLKEKHGVIHRDVKPSNILLDERGQIKLCDFGISGRLVDSKAKTRSAGCAAYMAPERIDPPDPTKPDYDIRADVWSLGISLVELATGQFPYKNCKTDFEVLTKVLQEEPPLLPGHMGFSGDFQSFVKDCLTKDHRKRPKYNKLLEHSFIKRYETLEVDVASWFKDVMAKTESPRTSGVLSQHHLPFFR
ncbi:PREDICTED: dual specificity mitogen-activated protein kinase kinase 7 [Bison bison bison]|uniref:Dual specificity mitogen-activated protein kinase kinase 7 n=1 Tax=Bison bison bison TaxID=43346 RepID=A0A6P3GJ31_BISBB|nr:PREDICTED: dual specificity mitogen-activated protein kinase kinase 7 [Bison bison bison]